MVHIPVLLKEVVEVLNPKPGEFFIDGTVGSGGHAKKIIQRISPNGIFLGIDLDKNAIENFELELKTKSPKLKAFRLVNGNYADLPEILQSALNTDYNGLKTDSSGLNADLRGLNADLRGKSRYKSVISPHRSVSLKADGLILDLGFSSEQLESRGLSFLRNEILDMRYNPAGENPTAREVINTFSEKDLADIFWKYGEERYSRRIAKKIVEERKKKPIKTTFELVEIINKFYMNYKTYRTYKIHPATRVFQALRIYVNDELGNLERLLKNLAEILKPGGRAAIISFHSLEDRLVKNHFRRLAKEGKVGILTKKPIKPTLEEVKQNPRSRSAKMRAITMY